MRQIVLFAAAAGGLYIAAYFTLVYYNVIAPDARYVPRFCRLEENVCRLVIHHPDARVFGVPNSVLGIVYYVLVIIATLGVAAQPLRDPLMYASWLTVGLALYLIYSLFVKVKVLCPMCLAAHGINVLIAALLTY